MVEGQCDRPNNGRADRCSGTPRGAGRRAARLNAPRRGVHRRGRSGACRRVVTDATSLTWLAGWWKTAEVVAAPHKDFFSGYSPKIQLNWLHWPNAFKCRCQYFIHGGLA